MLDVILKESLDKNLILNRTVENDINLCINLRADPNLRTYCYNNEINYNKGTDFCFIVDKSIDRLDEINDAIIKIIPSMMQNDTISVVTLSDNVEVIVNRLRKKDINIILDKVNDRLFYNNKRSNLLEGLEEARKVLENCSNEKIKKVILISGLSRPINEDEEYIIESELKLYKKLNITMDVLAVGENSNNVFLDKISSTLGGICYITTNSTDILVQVNESLKFAHATILNNVKIKINFTKFFRVRELYRGFPLNSYLGKVYSDNEIIIDVNNIEYNKQYSYYLNIAAKSPKTDFTGKFKMADIVVQYSVPSKSGDEIIETIPKKVYGVFTSDEREIKNNIAVVQGLSEVKIKMYEYLAREAKLQGKDIRVMNAYTEIIRLCSELGEIDLMRNYRDLLEEYKNNGQWNEDKIRMLSEESSKTSNSPYLPMPSL